MSNRLLFVLVMATLPLVLISCKRSGLQPSLPNKAGEPQAVVPNATAEPKDVIPKGQGVLRVLVRDESGNPVEGADIWIANKRGETYKTKSRKDGTTKGAGLISDNPFMVTVMLPGYEAQEARGISLSEAQPVFITLSLKRESK